MAGVEGMTLKGTRELVAAFNKHNAEKSKGMNVGLFRAGLFLQRESQKIVPIDKGILRASATTRAEGTGLKTQVIVGYGTDYALFVHENLEARHKPGKQAKYLEQPLREKRDRIMEIAREGLQKGE